MGQSGDTELDQVGRRARSKLYRCKRRDQRYSALTHLEDSDSGLGGPCSENTTLLDIAD